MHMCGTGRVRDLNLARAPCRTRSAHPDAAVRRLRERSAWKATISSLRTAGIRCGLSNRATTRRMPYRRPAAGPSSPSHSSSP
jgi:hypothetical protein